MLWLAHNIKKARRVCIGLRLQVVRGGRRGGRREEGRKEGGGRCEGKGNKGLGGREGLTLTAKRYADLGGRREGEGKERGGGCAGRDLGGGRLDIYS